MSQCILFLHRIGPRNNVLGESRLLVWLAARRDLFQQSLLRPRRCHNAIVVQPFRSINQSALSASSAASCFGLRQLSLLAFATRRPAAQQDRDSQARPTPQDFLPTKKAETPEASLERLEIAPGIRNHPHAPEVRILLIVPKPIGILIFVYISEPFR